MQQEKTESIKKAIEITDQTFVEILKFIKIGMTEKEIADKIDDLQKNFGGEENSFPTIVAFGINSAEPHWQTGETKVKNGGHLVLDFGTKVNGYCSDMTRTVFIGQEQNLEILKIYQVVLEAMNLAIKSVKASEKCFDVDKIARDYIVSAGYGEYFVHSTGHGLGKLIHDKPFMSYKSSEVLAVEDIITIEPGIYIKGLGGVRIEQNVLVVESGCEVLQRSSTKKIFLKML